MADSAPEKLNKRTIEYVNLVEGHRTKRLQWVVGGVVICILAIVFCIYKVLDHPWWYSLIIVIVAAATPNVIPCFASLKVFRMYVRRKNVRIKKLEAKLDTGRTSSGLRKDGTPKL